MPGKRITDHQVYKYKQHRNKLSQVASAAKAGLNANGRIASNAPAPAVRQYFKLSLFLQRSFLSILTSPVSTSSRNLILTQVSAETSSIMCIT